jgi:hypothetical protein
MLHAQICIGSSSWIVSLVEGTKEVCVLRVCPTEAAALEQATIINSIIIPQQKNILNKLENTQNALKDILGNLGPLPTTSEEFILAIRKAIKYIEEGKSKYGI